MRDTEFAGITDAVLDTILRYDTIQDSWRLRRLYILWFNVD